MNAARRKDLARAVTLIEEAQAIIEQASSDEQDAHEAISDRFPGSEQEATLSESSSALMDAEAACADVLSYIETASA